jgi:FeS assembly SUF system regulator
LTAVTTDLFVVATDLIAVTTDLIAVATDLIAVTTDLSAVATDLSAKRELLRAERLERHARGRLLGTAYHLSGRSRAASTRPARASPGPLPAWSTRASAAGERGEPLPAVANSRLTTPPPLISWNPYRYGTVSRSRGKDMIRITKQTDYGIVLLTHLASHPEGQYNAPDLAVETRLPLPMVSKILKVLARDGLLASHRGVKGGYSLARSPEAISMAEIISSLEGPIALTECIEVSGDCMHEPVCAVRSNWQRINEAVREALAGITLAEMVHPLPKLVTLGRGTFLGATARQL